LVLGLILVSIAVVVRMRIAANPVLRIPVVENKDVNPQVADLINQLFSQVVKSPESSEAWGEYGLVLMAHDFRDQAAECYDEAAQLDPQDYRWPYYHGITVAVKDRDTALTDFERAMQLAPENLSVRLRLAEWYYDLNQLEKATEHFRAASEQLAAGVSQTDATMYQARTEVGIARVLKDQGKKDEALQWALRAVKSPLGQRRDVWQLVAELHQQLGDTDEAMAAANAAEQAAEAAVWPEPEMGRAAQYLRDASLMYAQAELAWSQGQFEKAMQILLSIGELEPDDQKWKLRLGELFRDAKRFEDGIRFVSNTIKSHPTSARMHVLRAQMQIGQRNLAEAQADCEKAIELKPNYGEAYFVLGQLQIMAGNLDEAVVSLREATRLDAQLAPGFIALGEVLRRKGEASDAITAWKRAAKLAKRDFEVRVRLAELLIAQQRADEAGPYIQQAIALAEQAQDAVGAARAKRLLQSPTGPEDPQE
jgi:tetratricopeptide (TPR) repeat protein